MKSAKYNVLALNPNPGNAPWKNVELLNKYEDSKKKGTIIHEKKF